MKSKFIADIHISPLTIKELQKKGYDIIRVTDKLPATSLDKEIIQLAYQEKAVIITQDLDFSAIVSIDETEYRIKKLPVIEGTQSK